MSISTNALIKRLVKENYADVVSRVSVRQGKGTACGWKRIEVILKRTIIWNNKTYTKEQHDQWLKLDWETRRRNREISDVMFEIESKIERDIEKNFKDAIGYYCVDDLYNSMSSEMIVQIKFE